MAATKIEKMVAGNGPTFNIKGLSTEVRRIIWHFSLFPRIPTQPNEAGSGKGYVGWTGWERPNIAILQLNKTTNAEATEILYKTFPFEFRYSNDLWKFFDKIGHVNCSYMRAIRLDGIETCEASISPCSFTVKRAMKGFLSGRFESVVTLELVAAQDCDYYEYTAALHKAQAGEDIEDDWDVDEVVKAEDILRPAESDESGLPDDSITYLYTDTRKLSNSKDIRTLERFERRHHKKHSRFELRNTFMTYVPEEYSAQFVDQFYMEDSDNGFDIDSDFDDEIPDDYVPHVACDRWLQDFPTNADRIQPRTLLPRKLTFVDFSDADHTSFPNAEKKERDELGPALPVRNFGHFPRWTIMTNQCGWI